MDHSCHFTTYGFYVTTENPNVMMRENHNSQFSEYIIICQDGLYIVSTPGLVHEQHLRGHPVQTPSPSCQ